MPAVEVLRREVFGDSGAKIASHFRAICSPGRIIVKLFKFPRKYSIENLKNKLNVYAILYYENETLLTKYYSSY